MNAYVYILYSERSDHYYTGQSGDPVQRLGYHNSIEKGYTARYRPWKLGYTLKCDSKAEARQKEKMIKGWKNKNKVRGLVKGEITV